MNEPKALKNSAALSEPKAKPTAKEKSSFWASLTPSRSRPQTKDQQPTNHNELTKGPMPMTSPVNETNDNSALSPSVPVSATNAVLPPSPYVALSKGKLVRRLKYTEQFMRSMRASYLVEAQTPTGSYERGFAKAMDLAIQAITEGPAC